VSRLSPRVLAVAATAALVATVTSGCQADPPPSKQYAAVDKSICDASPVRTEFAKVDARRLQWALMDDDRLDDGDTNAECFALLPVDPFVGPPKVMRPNTYSLDLDVDADDPDRITQDYDRGAFFTVPVANRPPESESTDDLTGGWWSAGKIRTSTWKTSQPHWDGQIRTIVYVVAAVRDGNLLMSVAVQYPAVPMGQVATYTKKAQDLARGTIEAIKPELKTA